MFKGAAAIGIATQIPLPDMKAAPPTSSVAPASTDEPAASASRAPDVTAHRGFNWTIEQARAGHERLQQKEAAIGDHSIPSAPEEHAMYLEVVDAAEQVEGFPCSAHNRHKLRRLISDRLLFGAVTGG